MPIESNMVKDLVRAWREHLNVIYYPSDDAMLPRVADLYEQEMRYTNNIDSVGGEGTAARRVQAIRYWS